LQNELSEHINLIAAQEAKKRGVKVCLNAAPATTFSESFKEHIDLLVVNSIEARDMSGIEVTDLVTAEAAAKSLNAIYPIVIVTAGEHGVAFSKDLNCLGAIPSEKVELISTHGAGDCFMGTLCAKLVSGNDLIEAINKANKMAAVHVSTSPC
jgi:ribokinase